MTPRRPDTSASSGLKRLSCNPRTGWSDKNQRDAGHRRSGGHAFAHAETRLAERIPGIDLCAWCPSRRSSRHRSGPGPRAPARGWGIAGTPSRSLAPFYEGIGVFAPACPDKEGCRGSWWRWEGNPGWLGDQVESIAALRALDRSRIWLAERSGQSMQGVAVADEEIDRRRVLTAVGEARPDAASMQYDRREGPLERLGVPPDERRAPLTSLLRFEGPDAISFRWVGTSLRTHRL
jgi:hypothetical protein